MNLEVPELDRMREKVQPVVEKFNGEVGESLAKEVDAANWHASAEPAERSMPLLGAAAVAMWWDMAPAMRSEFEDWHSHEHFPERMSIPGFRRGSRWASEDGDEGFFVLYELEAYETLTSRDYLARSNDPTPWSTNMMPHHRHMVRSRCRILDSFGGGVAALYAGRCVSRR